MIEQQRELIALLLNARMEHIILSEIQDRLLAHTTGTHTIETYNYYFWTGAIFNTITAWLRNDPDRSVEEIAEMAYQIVRNMAEASGNDEETRSSLDLTP